jgi:glycosyltransferase involved in cell wall biosynthesis
VLPYLSATQSAVAQIAFRNGLPMIASRTGGLAEVIEEGIDGLLVPPGDPAALAGAIVAYFQRRLGPLFADRLASRSSKSKRNLIDVIERLAAN